MDYTSYMPTVATVDCMWKTHVYTWQWPNFSFTPAI